MDIWLSDEDSKLNEKAAWIIGQATLLTKVDESSDITSRVKDILDADNEAVIIELLEGLRRAEITSSEILERLHKKLRYSNDEIQLYAAHCLATQNIYSDEISKILLEYLTYETGDAEKDSRLILNLEILNQIGELSNEHADIRDTLIQFICKDKFKFRAIYSLNKLNSVPEELLAEIPKLLNDKEEDVRVCSLAILKKLSNPPESLLDPVFSLLSDESEHVRTMLAQVLGQWIGERERGSSALLKLTRDRESSVRNQAICSLGKLGYCSEAVINLLLDFLNQPAFAATAKESLGKIGKKSPKVLPALTQWIEQNENEPYVGNGIDVLWELVN